MARKITEDEISREMQKALDRYEEAIELLKMWVEYMDSDLSEAEKILVKKCKEFLGEK